MFDFFKILLFLDLCKDFGECKHNGKCVINKKGEAECECTSDFNGDHCEKKGVFNSKILLDLPR